MKRMEGYKTLADDMLVGDIVQGNSLLFDVLYERYGQKVLNKCISLIKNKSNAMDLVQNIFLKAYIQLPNFQKKSSFSTWLYAITYNECIDYLRKSNKRNLIAFIEDSIETLLLDIPDHVDEEFEYISQCELNMLLEQIAPEDRILVLMKYQENKSIKEIREIFGLSESAIKMRLKRIKGRIIQMYREQNIMHNDFVWQGCNKQAGLLSA